MNANSISSVDTKASLAPVKGSKEPASEAEATTEKKGFLDALSEVFGFGKSETKEGVSEVEGELSQALMDAEISAEMLTEDEASALLEEGEPTDNVAVAMSEGNELLERLGEASQTLQTQGNELPSTEDEQILTQGVDELTPEQAALVAQSKQSSDKLELNQQATASKASAIAWGKGGVDPAAQAQQVTQQTTQQNVGANPAEIEALKASIEAPSKDQLQAAIATAMGRDTRNTNAAQAGVGTEDFASQISAASGQNGIQANQIKAEVTQQAQAPLQLQKEMAGEQLAERVQMMLSKNLKNIDIRLDPPELGRMQIRLTMNGDVANVQITVANGQARDVIEQSMPRLREMLAQSGVQLSESSVQQQSSGQQQQYAAEDNTGSGGSLMEEGETSDEDITVDMNVSKSRDGISYFA